MKIDTIEAGAEPKAPNGTPSKDSVHVAIVNSDAQALASLDRDLRRRGFDVDTYSDPQSALNSILYSTPDIALFDMRMQESDIYGAFLRLREHSTVPVVLLTDSHDEVDEIVGLRMGADAVVRKPWSPQLLTERMRALSRRGRMAGAGDTGRDKIMTRPPLEMDGNRMSATWRGVDLDLTATEFKLLYTLAERPGYVRTRDFLMDRLYGADIFVLDRTVDSHVKRLRRKLRLIDPSFDAIETLYGAGYRLNLPGAAQGA